MVRPWSAALLTYLVGAAVVAAVTAKAGAGDDLTQVRGALLWSALPSMVMFLLMTVSAALAYSGQGGRGRYALAVLAVPSMVLVVGVLVGVLRGSAILEAVAIPAAGSALGMGLGFLGTGRGLGDGPRRRRGFACEQGDGH